MIVFHEGLPGAGKSYEAAVYHILPAIKSGRHVLTNIDGINHAKFSEVSGIPEPIVNKLIVTIDADLTGEEQRQHLLDKTVSDALIVIDEVQDFFPATRDPLGEEWTKYITQHRHLNLDIVLMGQDYRDCHSIWRRRIRQLVVFTNLKPVGRPNSYKWEVLEWRRRDKYEKINSGTREYDKQYFGLYSSFKNNGGQHFKVYGDDRGQVFNNAGFKIGIPLAVVAIVFAIFELKSFFNPVPSAKAEELQALSDNKDDPVFDQALANEVARLKSENEQLMRQQEHQNEQIEPDPPLDQFDSDARLGRLRLGGIVYDKNGKMSGYVDIVKQSGHLLDRYHISAIKDLGWNLELRRSGLFITKESEVHMARPWPLEIKYKVNRTTAEAL